MDLLSVTVTGFKRFRAKTNLQTNGKLLAILGPNEAGKSSFLEAIAHLGHDREFEAREVSRGVEPSACVIIGRFFLDADDLEIAGLDGPRWMILTKKKNGRRSFGFEPPAPARDIRHRLDFQKKLRNILERPDIQNAISQAPPELIAGIPVIIEALESDDTNISTKTLDLLQTLHTSISSIIAIDPGPFEEGFLSDWTDLVALERSPSPSQQAVNALAPRVPDFLFFNEAARDLKSSYSLTELRNNIPTALSNLLEVAELDLGEIFQSIDSGDNPRKTTLERRASRTLGRKFSSVWRQSGIEVNLSIQNDFLEIQVVNHDEEHTSLAERSDGLRQFVALQMFATRRLANNPILLIDEAEQRLHYDAQADLVQMLAKQNVSSKVIYTTHSAGCLPEDLGNGVRMVAPIEGTDNSLVVNRFWGRDSRGFSPLLYGMGASTLAFFPTRRAVLVEGASDMLLYPTIFREVLNQTNLGFQFVPGLSNIERTMSHDALQGEIGLVYLVDGDEGGSEIATNLKRKGVSENNILVARNSSGTAVELEDFIDPKALVKAVNRIIDKFHNGSEYIDATRIGSNKRMAALEAAFFASTAVKLPKVDLAYELLDQIHSDPTTRLVDARRRQTLEDLVLRIATQLEPPKVASKAG
ncbi:AAA family ATPase [Caulobacter sp. CCG-8]|uniref:AAA family ATPase n=1 Tax=Caulobacter sp. CCG-8 TaxID=3127958 RepID=UPI00307D2720